MPSFATIFRLGNTVTTNSPTPSFACEIQLPHESQRYFPNVLPLVATAFGLKDDVTIAAVVINDHDNPATQAINEMDRRDSELDPRLSIAPFGKGGELHGLDERKWLSKDEGAPTYTMLFAGKTALISLNSDKEPIGVVVEDNNTYNTKVMIFKAIWEKL